MIDGRRDGGSDTDIDHSLTPPRTRRRGGGRRRAKKFVRPSILLFSSFLSLMTYSHAAAFACFVLRAMYSNTIALYFGCIKALKMDGSI